MIVASAEFLQPLLQFLNKDDRNYVKPDISIICGFDKLGGQGCAGVPILF